MQIGTQNVPFWESGCGELETGPQTGKIDPVEDFFPLIVAMPLAGLTQGAQVVQHLWMAVGSVEDWTGRPGDRASGAKKPIRAVVRKSSYSIRPNECGY